MLRIILHNQRDGRIVRDEQFEPMDERDVPKAFARAIRAAVNAEPLPRGEAHEFRLTIIRYHR